MKKPTLNSILAYLFALFVVALVLLGLAFARQEWKRAIGEISSSRDNDMTERFVPSSCGRLRGLNEKFVIVTDATTGEEYMFVQGCGGVHLEKQRKGSDKSEE